MNVNTIIIVPILKYKCYENNLKDLFITLVYAFP